jgi:uncharacterized protein (TIGR02284 family)
MSNTEHCIEICNKLLRGERSAVETYDQAIKKHGDKPVLVELDRLLAEHRNAVRTLENNVLSMGGQPADTAGAWGAVANTVQGAANLLGAGSALEALQKGEQSGKHDYEEALKDADVMPECKNLIRAELLPMVSEHIATLERLQKAA